MTISNVADVKILHSKFRFHGEATTTTTSTAIIMNYSSIFVFKSISEEYCTISTSPFLEECSKTLMVDCNECHHQIMIHIIGTYDEIRKVLQKIYDNDKKVCFSSFGCFDFITSSQLIDSNNFQEIHDIIFLYNNVYDPMVHVEEIIQTTEVMVTTTRQSLTYEGINRNFTVVKNLVVLRK